MSRAPIHLAAAVQRFLATGGAVDFDFVRKPGTPHPPRHFKHKARLLPARRSRSRGALLKRGQK